MTRHANQEQPSGLATFLGWFSIGLGVVELAAPGWITRAVGLKGSESLVRAYGAREIATGIGLLCSANPAPWLWGRVAGDALDLATLAPALSPANRHRDGALIAITAVAGVTALDLYAASAACGSRERHFDYSDRRGMPSSPEAMRGIARDFEVPRDMRAPEALRPWRSDRPESGQGAFAA